MTTQKLYHTDSYIQEFTAHIDKTLPLPDGRWGIVLDRTAFYPEGGGQPADTGWLDDIAVLDVTETDGLILHITAAQPQSATVTGRLDWTRRFDHMQQHSGEHLLSAAFGRLFGAENIGFHLGPESVTIDVTLDNLTPEQATAAEDSANAFIYANIPVGGLQVTGDTLKEYPLRKQPTKHFDHIRLVNIEGVDCCPCGGTHVAATGEVGLIKIRSWERRNNATRVEFVSGWRALADYRLHSATVRQLSGRLSAPPQEVAAAAERQFARAETLAKALQTARQELLRHLAAELYQSAGSPKIIVKVLPDATAAEMADLGRQLVALGPVAALLAIADPGQNKSQLLFAATPGTANMAALLKTVLARLGGKGGGSPHWAQGGGPYTADLADILQQAARDL